MVAPVPPVHITILVMGIAAAFILLPAVIAWLRRPEQPSPVVDPRDWHEEETD